MTKQTEEQAELREEVFGGKTLQQNLRDIVARNNTGYPYDELIERVNNPDNEDMLDEQEVADVDEAVNILGHLFAKQKEEWEKEVTSKIRVAYESARAATGTEEGRKAIDFFYSVHLNSWPGIAHLSSKESSEVA